MKTNDKQAEETASLISQLQFARETIDNDMSVLSVTVFLLVGTFPEPGGAPMSKIVDRLGLNRSTASRNVYTLCGGMVRRNQPKKGYGLVYTEASDTDRRALNVFLTPKGKSFLKGLLAVR
jgi:DNA-binding MarR family transcriptional regulator